MTTATSRRAVLFDLDGTLIDSHALIIASFRHACREALHRELSDDEAQAQWGRPLTVRFAAIAPDRVPALVEAYAAYYGSHERELASAFPGVPEMLATLARLGCALAVVTSKRTRAAAQAIRVLGLASWIATIVGAEDASAPKPAPDPVYEALRRLGAAADSALMVGDGPFDIGAARAAGVKAAAALWGTREADAVLASGPDYVVRTPAEVPAIVASG